MQGLFVFCGKGVVSAYTIHFGDMLSENTNGGMFTIICLPSNEKEADEEDGDGFTLVDIRSFSEPFEHVVAYINDCSQDTADRRDIMRLSHRNVSEAGLDGLRASILCRALRWLHAGFPGSVFRIPIRMCDNPKLFSIVRRELDGDDIEVWVEQNKVERESLNGSLFL